MPSPSFPAARVGRLAALSATGVFLGSWLVGWVVSKSYLKVGQGECVHVHTHGHMCIGTRWQVSVVCVREERV